MSDSPVVVLDKPYSEIADSWSILHHLAQKCRSQMDSQSVYAFNCPDGGMRLLREMEANSIDVTNAVSITLLHLPSHFIHIFDEFKDAYVQDVNIISYNGLGYFTKMQLATAQAELTFPSWSPIDLRVAGDNFIAVIAVDRVLWLRYRTTPEDLDSMCDDYGPISYVSRHHRPFALYTEEELENIGGRFEVYGYKPYRAIVKEIPWDWVEPTV